MQNGIIKSLPKRKRLNFLALTGSGQEGNVNKLGERFVPENKLEEKMLRAQQGEISLSDFISYFILSYIFIPSATPISDDMRSATPLIYEREGKKLLAIFSSLERAKMSRSHASYCLGMHVKELLLRMPLEHGIVINPGCRIGLEIDPVAVHGMKVMAQEGL